LTGILPLTTRQDLKSSLGPLEDDRLKFALEYTGSILYQYRMDMIPTLIRDWWRNSSEAALITKMRRTEALENAAMHELSQAGGTEEALKAGTNAPEYT